ncbi:hypothetical protein AAVH_26702 [Aphelenchoides avenae]|nr:hypothetical protein AAVH_26702 [Aphelenchus avenae]
MLSLTSILSVSACLISVLLAVQARPQSPGYYYPYSGYPYGGQVPFAPTQNAVAAPAQTPSSSQQRGVESHFAPGAQYPWLSLVYDSQ